MNTDFFDRLAARVRDADTLLAVGLDPHAADLAEPTAAEAKAFCLRLIEATAEYAAAFKPNAAFFEALGAEGFAALGEVIAAVPDDIPVLLDVKRGDIASTAAAYATAAFDVLGADAVTLSPYMGHDSITPFLEHDGAGAFVLCRTSNPSGDDLQDLSVTGPDGETRPLYLEVAALAERWGVGVVVGATRPSELAAVRAAAPRVWILAPGVGAQGGDAAHTVAAGLREDGLGLLVPVSRGISRADDPASAAKALRDTLRQAARARHAHAVSDARRRRVARGLLDAGCVRFGEFTLKSGLTSPIYLDLRRLVGDAVLLDDVAGLYAEALAELSYDVVAPLPYAAMPIGTAICLRTGDPMVYPRREVKQYGTKRLVEGVFEPGQTAVVVDDLATTGGSKIEGIDKLRTVGLEVTDTVVLVDRESGAAETMAEAGVGMHAVFTLSELLDGWEEAGDITSAQAQAVRDFLADTAAGS